MITAVAALACALDVLGRSAASLPPIHLIDEAPRHASANVEAFVPTGSGTIFILTTSAAFLAVRQSNCDDPDALRKLASIIVHETWHVEHGADETRAYEAQLGALVRLGVAPGTPLYTGVVQSMFVAERRQRQAAAHAAPSPLQPIDSFSGDRYGSRR